MQSTRLSALASQASERITAALAQDDWESAAETVVAHWGPLISFRQDTIAAVCEAAPAAVLDQRPEWGVLRSYLRRLQTRPDLRPALYADSAPDPTPLDPPLTQAILLISRAAAARTEGHSGRASALAGLAENAARQAPPDHPLLVPLLIQCALTHEFAAEIGPAIRLLVEAHHLAEAAGNLRAAITTAGELGWLLALIGDGATADSWLDRHRALRAGAPGVAGRMVPAQMGRAVRLADDLAFAESQQALEEIDRHLSDEHGLLLAGIEVLIGSRLADDRGGALLSRFDARIMGALEPHRVDGLNGRLNVVIRSDVLALRGDAAAALRTYDGVEPSAAHLVPARIAATHLLLGEDDEADAAARETTDGTAAWPRARIEAIMVRAAVALHRQRLADAADLFRTALDAARRHRALMALIRLPSEDIRALAALVGPAAHAAELDALLGGRIPLPAAGQRIVRPTAGEQRLLAVLGDDSDEQGLAAQLGVSRNTVRTQLHTLYRKFGVNSRDALRASARREGLL